jgi:hypothetical protein
MEGNLILETYCLSHDLKGAFPDMGGFSPRNLKYMRKFAESSPDRSIVQRTVAQIPWRSNLALLDKLQDSETRLWYVQAVVAEGIWLTSHTFHDDRPRSNHFVDASKMIELGRGGTGRKRTFSRNYWGGMHK